MKKKKSVCLAIGGLLGLAYFIYICVYFTGVNTSSTDAAEAMGGSNGGHSLCCWRRFVPCVLYVCDSFHGAMFCRICSRQKVQ